MNALNFSITINNLRKESKGKWYFWRGMVEGKEVKVKGYETWLQILSVNYIDYSNSMERKVKDFIIDLLKPFV